MPQFGFPVQLTEDAKTNLSHFIEGYRKKFDCADDKMIGKDDFSVVGHTLGSGAMGTVLLGKFFCSSTR